MTHYEELGVDENATPDQIRKAYHLLTRILHPDLQSNPELRSAAEVQMRRLNEVVETLCDSSRRSDYDRYLRSTGETDPAAHPVAVLRRESPRQIPRSKELLILFTGVTAGAFLMLLLTAPRKPMDPVSLAINDTSRAQAVGQGVAAPSQGARKYSSATTSLGVRPSNAPLGNALSGNALSGTTVGVIDQSTEIRHPPYSFPETPSLHGEQRAALVSSLSSLESPFSTTLSPPEARNHPNEAGKNEANRSEPKKFEGVWLYVKERKQAVLPGEYSAEFVELRLREEDRKLRGSFRSRYHVQDRAFSPEVSFSFSGSIGENEYAWAGPKGSRGKLQLLMERPNVLKLEWVAEVPGPGSSLMEGSALLIRRLDSADAGFLTRP